MGFYLGTCNNLELELVLGYRAEDGTKIEIYEEKSKACWHLAVLRPGQKSPKGCMCLSYKQAYSLFRHTIEVCENNVLLN